MAVLFLFLFFFCFLVFAVGCRLQVRNPAGNHTLFSLNSGFIYAEPNRVGVPFELVHCCAVADENMFELDAAGREHHYFTPYTCQSPAGITSRSRGPDPLPPRSKSCSFQAILTEKEPYFKHILGSGPPWGQNSTTPWAKSWIRCWVYMSYHRDQPEKILSLPLLEEPTPNLQISGSSVSGEGRRMCPSHSQVCVVVYYHTHKIQTRFVGWVPRNRVGMHSIRIHCPFVHIWVNGARYKHFGFQFVVRGAKRINRLLKSLFPQLPSCKMRMRSFLHFYPRNSNRVISKVHTIRRKISFLSPQCNSRSCALFVGNGLKNSSLFAGKHPMLVLQAQCSWWDGGPSRCWPFCWFSCLSSLCASPADQNLTRSVNSNFNLNSWIILSPIEIRLLSPQC